MKLPLSHEKLFNLIFGLNIIGWSIAGIFFSTDFELTPVRICISAINLLAGVLIITRNKAIVPTVLLSNPHWLIVLFCNGYLFHLAQPLSSWPFYATLLFVVSTIFVILSFVYLGQNFSIRPSVRGLSSKGPYRLVRHPAYLGEILMTLSCVMVSMQSISFLVFIILIGFQIVRIKDEEQLLNSNLKDYQSYRQVTKWRLIPFVW